MLIYRALNEKETEDYHNSSVQEISASRPEKNPQKALNQIISHVRAGSANTQKDCWISTCKSLFTCIREYAIPQGGKFCTAMKRKNIAIIDFPYPGNTEPQVEQNYTLFYDEKGLPIQDTFLSQYPYPALPINSSKGRLNFIDQQKNKFLDGMSHASFGAFDCSMPSPQTSPRKVADIQFLQEKCLMQWGCIRIVKGYPDLDEYHHGILKGVINGPTTSIIQNSKEVLIWNHIPKKMIQIVLTPIMQDIIYYAGINNLGLSVLDDFMQNRLSVAFDNNVITITTNHKRHQIPVSSPDLFTTPLYQLIPDTAENIETFYQNLVSEKEQYIRQIVSFLYPDKAFEDNHIPENNHDAVIILDADQTEKACILNARQKHDLVAVKFKGELFLHKGKKKITKKLLSDLQEKNKIELTNSNAET